MDAQQKQAIFEKYKKAKENGIYFFPDAIFKDAVVALAVFLVLVALAYFRGAPLEAPANPADTTYTPRPEWYFMFLFQLLKYFPGELEVIGVVVIPTLAVLALFLLPFIDSGPQRHFTRRPLAIGTTAILAVGVIFLTVQAVREAPPPVEAASGDPTAMLYTNNCAGCHGEKITVPPGTNLHDVIAQGKHEGMPAWSADLTSDQIDALAGFILSPAGSKLFADNCAGCHEAPELVAGDPIELKAALDEGPAYPPHASLEIPEWSTVFNREARTSLVNFLVAPDGQRLFATNCAPCHGRSVAVSAADQENLLELISKGGLHLEMPPWREKLAAAQIDTLARYVVDPASILDGPAIFEKYCTTCHGERIPQMEDVAEAREVIATGGAHETMPVWGEVLTSEQLAALVAYTLNASTSTVEAGQELFAKNCASCHGDFGEGGENPSRADDIIAPISTAEYLKTRDDTTLQLIISQGQPNFGMSPFGAAFGGPLEDAEIDTIVGFIRAWEANPPVELPPEISFETLALSGVEIFSAICAQCHDPNGVNFTGSTLRDSKFRNSNTSQDIFDTISDGHAATQMIAWGSILTSQQIEDLVKFIVSLPVEDAAATGPSFALNVLPLFETYCTICHPSDGGWDATSYEGVMTTGDHAPGVIPGDVENSLLALKMLGKQTEGDIMPPLKKVPEDQIQMILDWIAAGAPDN